MPSSLLIAFPALLVSSVSFVGAADLPLMPMPANLELSDGSEPLRIDGDFRLRICGPNAQALRPIANVFLSQLERVTGIPMPDAGGRYACSEKTNGPSLAIETPRMIAIPRLGDDESYTLQVTARGADLHAPTSLGILRGLATFQQLTSPGKSGFELPAVSIQDRPRFAWRGFMLDASRHWMPLEVVKRNLEALAAVKLNVFHWHLTDDQGWRFESKLFPRLQEIGSDGRFYTQAQIREVVEFASRRGIRVVPEFDIPGHATALLLAYPEFGSGPAPKAIERKWGVFRPTLDPSRESTYHFLEALIGEMAALFPDPYFHIGGDEVLDSDWKDNARIQAFSRAHGFATSAQLHAYFNRRVDAILARHGKIVIGWDEVLTPGLPTNIVIQSWRGTASLAAAAKGGYRGLLSNGYYLDHARPASEHYSHDPMSGDAANLTPDEASRILGGEACMWTEYASDETVDSRIWPRTAAIAERLWSPASVTDPDSMYARLETLSRQLDWTGLQHRKAQEDLLARIAGERFRGPELNIMSGAIHALGHDDRYHAREYNSLVPLNRLVDAAFVESEPMRRLAADARQAASDPAARTRLRDTFALWRDLRFPSTSLLDEDAELVAGILSDLGKSGVTMLDLIERHEHPNPDWLESERAAVKKAQAPVAELHIAGADVIAVLLDSLAVPLQEQSPAASAKR